MTARGGGRLAVAASLLTLVAIGLRGPEAAWGGGATTTTPTTTVAPTQPPRTTVPRTLPTVPQRATTVPATTATTAPEPIEEDSEPDTSATTIALIVGTIFALLLILLVVVLINRRRAKDRWADDARAALADGQRLMGSVVHGLSTLAQPAAAASTWADVDDQGAQLHRRLQALARRAPDDRARAVATRADEALQHLRSAVDSDRALRLGPPPPTQEQLGYSEAVVRQRASDFEQAVEDLDLLLRDDR